MANAPSHRRIAGRRANQQEKKTSQSVRTKRNSGSSAASPTSKRAKPAYGVRAELEELRQKGAFWLWIRERLAESPGWATSAIVHALILVILMLIAIAPDVSSKVVDILATNDTDEQEEFEEINDDLVIEDLDVEVAEQVMEVVDTEVVSEEPEVSEFSDEAAAEIAVELSEIGLQHAPKSDLLNKIGSTTGNNPLGGRGKAARARLVAQGGGNAASEAAVAMGLKWLAAHQNPDGSWSFDHGKCPRHQGPVNHPGNVKSLTGATGMALLPFLGAGQTHKDGEYKETVYRGLHFLARSMKFDPNKGGDLQGQGGSMYCHGLAAITLCEAYALTQDKALMQPAQQSVNFIVYAQDKTGGGWRYNPHQPGDTSVLGWQLMALKSAHLAYLKVPKQTIAGAINFLDSVQAQGSYGAYYGYLNPAKRSGTTAVGLLCRMYLGWKKGEPGLIEGVKYLSNLGPAKNNMYYNYYATQVLHHWGGDEWKKWNSVMRDQLVNTQIAKGSFVAEKGSWTPTHQHHGERGGRLYETSMSVMTLEIYYRYMPLYKEAPAQDDF